MILSISETRLLLTIYLYVQFIYVSVSTINNGACWDKFSQGLFFFVCERYIIQCDGLAALSIFYYHFLQCSNIRYWFLMSDIYNRLSIPGHRLSLPGKVQACHSDINLSIGITISSLIRNKIFNLSIYLLYCSTIPVCEV